MSRALPGAPENKVSKTEASGIQEGNQDDTRRAQHSVFFQDGSPSWEEWWPWGRVNSVDKCDDRSGTGGSGLHVNCICVSPAGGIGCDAINTESWVRTVTFPAGWPRPTYEDSVTPDFAHFFSNKNTWKVYGTFLLTAHMI